MTDRLTGTAPSPASPPEPEASGHRLTRGLVIGGAVAAGVVALYLGLLLAAGAGVPRGVTVVGVDIGGMSSDEAVAKLSSETATTASADIHVKAGTQTFTVSPQDAGLSFDAAATVAGVTGRDWSPWQLFSRLFSGGAVAPVVHVDQAKLATEVTRLASDIDQPVVEPSIKFVAAQPKLTPGEVGTALDRTAASAQIQGSYLTSPDVVVLALTKPAPSVSGQVANAALADARTAVAAPVVVNVSTLHATLTPAAIASALTYVVKDGAMTPQLDGNVLRATIAGVIAPVETAGRDATWKIVKGKPVVVPSKVGNGVNPAALATSVTLVLDKSAPADRVVDATIGAIPPLLTTAQAQALGVVEKVSSFTQHFPYAAYRVQNIGQAAKYINGTLLKPGETFSMNDTIKERTPANGYTTGYVIGPGGVFKEDLGGGVSTATTTMWTAAFYAGLERVFTQAHSIWISRYQPGLEATVAWGFFDMKFRNNTPHGVFITTDMKNTSLTITIWGTKVYDKVLAVSGPRTDLRPFKTLYDPTPTCHAQAGEPGFKIVVTRVLYLKGKVVKTEPITTSYQPSPNVICHADPAKVKPTPVPVVPPVKPPVVPAKPAA